MRIESSDFTVRPSITWTARFTISVALLGCAACTVPINTGLGARRPPETVDSAAEATRRAYETGNVNEGEDLARRAEQASDADPGEKPELARTLTEIALQQSRKGNNAEALELHQRALLLREEAYGVSHPDVAESLSFLGAAYYQEQRYDEAEKAFVRALAIRKEKLGPNDRLTGLSMNNLAFFYAGVGKYEQADPLFVESIRILDGAPETTWAERARARDNYAAMLLDAGRTDEAAEIEKQAATYRGKRKQIEDVIKTTK